MSGITLILTPAAPPEPPGAWVTERHLGLTADRSRVVDYYSTEAAFNFRSPGKKVTAEESERYGISADHPYSSSSPVSAPGVLPLPPEPDPETESEDAMKAAAKPANKMVQAPANKGRFGRRKGKAK